MGYLLSKNTSDNAIEDDCQNDDFMDWVEDSMNN